MSNNNISYNWSNLSKEDILHRYCLELEQFKEYGKQYNISDNEMNQIFQECFQETNNIIPNKSNLERFVSGVGKCVKCTAYIVFSLLIICVAVSQHAPTTSFVLRNVQGLIYPGLKIWRKMSVPIIEKFPVLTELYDESCLLPNPYFQVDEMDCWPCEQIKMVPNLSALDVASIQQYGMPYIVKTGQSKLKLQMFKDFYYDHQKVLNNDAPRIYSSNNSIKSVKDMMESLSSLNHYSDSHFIWRINRMSASRLLRGLIPRPYIVPQLGQSTERFILFMGANAPSTKLPDTECSNVFLLQLTGQRNIVLHPSTECRYNCRSVSILLKQSFVLVYSWWYYRPISLPDNISTSESVTFMGSYC